MASTTFDLCLLFFRSKSGTFPSGHCHRLISFVNSACVFVFSDGGNVDDASPEIQLDRGADVLFRDRPAAIGRRTQTLSGTWTGVESVTVDTGMGGGEINTGSAILTLNMTFDPFSGLYFGEMSITGGSLSGLFSVEQSGQSFTGSIATGNGYSLEYGNFFLTFQSIPPDGDFDTSNSSAVADMTLSPRHANSVRIRVLPSSLSKASSSRNRPRSCWRRRPLSSS